MRPDTMVKLAKPMLFTSALIWGTSFFVMKNTLDVIPALWLLVFRFATGAVLVGLACWRKWRRLTRDYLWRGAVLGGLLVTAYSLQTFGLVYTTPSKNAFLTSVYCVIVPFLYWLVAKKRPDRYHIAAALLCVTGVGLVSLSDALSVNTGDWLTLGSSLFYALHIVAVKRLSQDRDIYLLTVWQFAFAALFALGGGLLTQPFPAQALADPATWGPLLYLCVMASAVALLFQNVGQFWSEPAAASVLLSLESVFGVLFSVLFYGDPVTPRLLAGFAMIFVAVVCSETKFSFLRQKVKHCPEP